MGREKVLFKTEEKKDVHSVAVFLRELADKLDQQKVVITRGKESVKLKVPATVELEIKVEEEIGKRKKKKKLELEIEWVVGGDKEKGSGSVTLG